ncbi:MAG: hypothetical protein ACXABD_21325 [Candidatus Thorarchaeota archaeon]
MGKKAFTEFQKEVAFDAYYAMGAARDLKALSISLQDTPDFKDNSPAHVTLRKWSSANNWQERCTQRDIDNAKKVQAQTDKSVVNSKADHRKLIKELLEQDNTLDGYAITLVGTAFDLITSGEMKVQTIKELVELMRTHQGSTAKKLDLIKTDLLLMGEADSRSEEKIIIVNDLTGAGDED